jgi:prefoldin subunit 5
MIQKLWSDMTQDEKLDVLRNEIERLFAAINLTNSNVSQLDNGMTELFNRLTTTQKKGRQVAQEKAVIAGPDMGMRKR